MDRLKQARIRRWAAEPTDENAQALAAAIARSEGVTPQVRKVIISPGYGSGFASDVYPPEAGRVVAEFPPLVAAIEADDAELFFLALDELADLLTDQFGEDFHAYPVFDRAFIGVLHVREVVGPYRINEYDGSESIETLDQALERFW